MAETGSQELVKAEAAKAYRAVRDMPGTPRGCGNRLPCDPVIASLYDMPVWQRAVESHLSTAYGSDLRPNDRQHSRHPGIKRDRRPLKRSDLNQEFVEKLKQGESTQPIEDQTALLSPEAASETAPCESAPVGAVILSPSPVAEMSPSVTDAALVTARLAEGNLPDSPEAVYLQEMMNEVQNDFSSRAESLLDALGMGHMKRGSGGKAEDGNHKLSGKELVLALEKLVREKKTKVL
jgi:hypothetical protein